MIRTKNVFKGPITCLLGILFFLPGISFSCDPGPMNREEIIKKSSSIEIITVYKTIKDQKSCKKDGNIYKCKQNNIQIIYIKENLHGNDIFPRKIIKYEINSTEDGYGNSITSCGNPEPLIEGETYIIFNNNYKIHTAMNNPNRTYNEYIDIQFKQKILSIVGSNRSILYYQYIIIIMCFIIIYYIYHKNKKSKNTSQIITT